MIIVTLALDILFTISFLLAPTQSRHRYLFQHCYPNVFIDGRLFVQLFVTFINVLDFPVLAHFLIAYQVISFSVFDKSHSCVHKDKLYTTIYFIIAMKMPMTIFTSFHHLIL